MLCLCYKHYIRRSVCLLSITLVDWDHAVQENENWHIGVLPKLIQFILSCHPEFYAGRQAGYGKRGVLLFNLNQLKVNNCVRCNRIRTSRHTANKPQIIKLIEDSRRPVEDVDLARRTVERPHGETVRKRTNEERSDSVDWSHLVWQQGSLRLTVIDQEHLTCSTTQTTCTPWTYLVLLVRRLCTGTDSTRNGPYWIRSFQPISWLPTEN